MKKKVFLIIAVVFVLGVTSALTFALSPRKNLKPSEYNIGVKYEAAVKDKKPMIALFYADWCTYCMRFMPKYKIISEVYRGKYNFVMINIDNPNYKKLVKDYSIDGFPTIYIIDPSIDERIHISSGLYGDLFKLRTEFDRYLRIRVMIKK